MIGKLILGTAQIGMNYGVNNRLGKINYTESVEILNFAYQSGIEFLDTAPVYGDAQKVIGDFHRLNPAFKFKVISKIPKGFNIFKIESLIENFLSEMNIDEVEILHFHSIDDFIKVDLEELKIIINRLKLTGKVKYLGVSIYDNSEIINLISEKLIDIVQLPFNLLDNINIRGDLLEQLKSSEKTIHSRSVFLQGLFFMESSAVIDTEVRSYILALNYICKKNNLSMEELALQYCLSQNNIDNILIGVDSLTQLKRNISISNKKLSKEVINQVETLIISNPASINPSVWKII
jgi:aryl-alcohol dehydrogenase-like predicted oxidoreductase